MSAPAGFAHAASLAHTTRYCTVAGLTVVLLDEAESFADEVALIWRGRRGLERVLFLVHRHLTIVGMLFAAHMSSGFAHLTDTVGPIAPRATFADAALVALQDCRALLGVTALISFVSVGLADGLVTMEVWQLWDCSRRAMVWLLAGFLFTNTATLVFMLLSVRTTFANFEFQPGLNVCALDVTPRILAGMWASGMIFDLAVFVSTLWNVLDKPRKDTAKLTALLMRDGAAYFAAVMALRLTNLATTLTSGPSGFFTSMLCVRPPGRRPFAVLKPSASLTWGLLNTLVHRLVLNQSRERNRLRHSVHLGALPVITSTQEVFELDGKGAP
ncbi:hypothetical protein AURDEDRAFT_128268 [Auricularia subglabra TFB-10046 SS5]|nr:hypothetical protein AURDEDRAFT_128268 [Auricularia subglabra TFB-10046 SS5]